MSVVLTAEGIRRLSVVHPWLYHVVHRADEATRETIATDGLAPGPSRHRWHPLFRPRPGHVYLATYDYTASATWNLWRQGDDMYAVWTGDLLAAHCNPDEDRFSGDCADACDHFALPRPAGMDLWKTFGEKVIPSFGEWAEQVNLGADPRQTMFSAINGSLAYSGVVPPTALRRWDGKRWDSSSWKRCEW